MVQEKGRYEIKFSVDGKTWTKKKNVGNRPKVHVTQDIGNRNAGLNAVCR